MAVVTEASFLPDILSLQISNEWYESQNYSLVQFHKPLIYKQQDLLKFLLPKLHCFFSGINTSRMKFFPKYVLAASFVLSTVTFFKSSASRRTSVGSSLLKY